MESLSVLQKKTETITSEVAYDKHKDELIDLMLRHCFEDIQSVSTSSPLGLAADADYHDHAPHRANSDSAAKAAAMPS